MCRRRQQARLEKVRAEKCLLEKGSSGAICFDDVQPPEKLTVFEPTAPLKSPCIIRLGLYPCRKLPTYFTDEAEFIRTGKRLKEIKHVANTATAIENATNLPESLRILVPRIARSMIYDIRSKTGAVHVKEIDPRYMDASLAIQAASWVTAEFLRLYHKSSDSEVSIAMAALMRTHVPFVELFGDEVVVTQPVKCEDFPTPEHLM